VKFIFAPRNPSINDAPRPNVELDPHDRPGRFHQFVLFRCKEQVIFRELRGSEGDVKKTLNQRGN
jgi:hypothetical protein